MRLRNVCALAAGLSMALAAAGVRAQPASLSLDLRAAGPLAAAATSGAPLTVSVPRMGAVPLTLRHNRLRGPGTPTTMTGADGVARPVAAAPVLTLAGHVTGDASSVVRLTVAASGISGFVSAGGERVWIQPDPADPRRTVAAPDSGEIEFGDDAVEVPVAASAAASHPAQVNVQGIGSCAVSCGTLTAHVILDGDMHYTALGADCFGRQLAVLNAVDGIYAATATKIKLSVAQQNCRTAPDLGPVTTEPVPLLMNLRTAWSSTGVNRSLVYLFTGYDLPTSVVGVGYTPGVCGRIDPDPAVIAQRCTYGYSLGQMVGTMAAFDKQVKVTAHEIGHNFNASHDDAGCAGSGRLMCSAIQPTGPLEFSAFSANQIRSHAEETIGYLASV